jgi:hypothetical protein
LINESVIIDRKNMSTIKTVATDANVADFITAFADTDQKRRDSFDLVKIMESYTGHKAKMWGPTIIGFGFYHYKSEKSRQEADMLLVGFSPRKAAISLYVYIETPENESLLAKLGKFKMGKGCIYIKKLNDINIDVLKQMMGVTIATLQEK